MKTKKQYLVNMVIHLVKSFVVHRDEKRALYLSYMCDMTDDPYRIHMLFIKSSSTTINAFGISTRISNLAGVESITQYTASTGGVLLSQIENMMEDLLVYSKKDFEFNYLNLIELFEINSDNDYNVGSDFSFIINEKKITLKRIS